MSRSKYSTWTTSRQASLGATLTQMSWVVSSYAIANVIILPLSAWLGQRFGKKNYFLFSLAGFTFASILCGVSTSLWMLTVARILQGLFGGGLLAKAQAILFETFPREEQAMAQGFFGAIVIAGPVMGPTLGGYIVTNIGWRWIFFINVPIGIAALSMVGAALPKDESFDRDSPVDWWAIALLAIGLGCFETFLEEGYSDDWFDSPFITAMAVIAVSAIVAFVWRSLKSKHPVVDLRVLRYRALSAGMVLSEKLVATDPSVQSRLAMLANGMMARGADPVMAKQRALTMMDGSVRMQSAVLAFNDTFWVTALLVVCSIPLIFVLGKPASVTTSRAASH